jgi:hypothetical protein
MRSDLCPMLHVCISCSLSGLDISPELPLWARARHGRCRHRAPTPTPTRQAGGDLSETATATGRHTFDRHLDQDSDLDVTTPTNLDTTAVHPTWARYSVCLYWQSPAWARSVLSCAASSSSHTDAWPTARNSSGIVLWRRDMQRSV